VQRIERNGFEITRALWAYAENGKYAVFAGGNRLEAVRQTSHKDNVPLLLHEGFTIDEIVSLETQDNKNDEYHTKISVVDVWAEYARLRDEEGWTQERIASAKGISQPMVTYRLKLHDKLPEEIKKFITQGKLEETHCREIINLSLELYFSPWLTTEQLWLKLAKKAIDGKLSVSQLKQEVDRWKKILDKAKTTYTTIPEKAKRYTFSMEDGIETYVEHEYNPRDEFVSVLAKLDVNSQAKIDKALVEINTELICQSQAYEEYLRRKVDAEERMRQQREKEQKIQELKMRYANMPICGDAFKILPTLNHFADTIILDPPYFTSTGDTNNFVVDKGEWDKELSPIEQEEYYHNLLSLCRDNLKDNGTVWCFGTYHNIFAFGQALRKLGFYILNMITWAKPNVKPVNLMNDTKFVPSAEYIIWARKNADISNHVYNFETIKKLNNGDNMWDVWELSTERQTEHPTEKPEKLIERMISACTNKDSIVLDPFSGSGTTAVVCKRIQRICINIESEKKWCEVIEKRLDEVEIILTENNQADEGVTLHSA
jgi:site-specific DNA-methyltransferase (adenine-specific)